MFGNANWNGMKHGIKDLLKFRNLPIFWKISFMPILAVSLMMIGFSFYMLPLTKEKFIDDKKTNASNVVSVAYTVVAEYGRRVAKGELTLKEAQDRAKESVRRIRFGKNRDEYIWINDLEPKMLMNPIYPELQGKNLSDFKDQNGKQFLIEMVKVAREKGEGYVEYVLPKAKGDNPSAEISYVKLYKPWGWVIGSDIYVDDVMITVWKILAGIAILSVIISVVVTTATFIVGGGFISGPVKEYGKLLQGFSSAIATGKGDVSSRLSVRSNDEIGKLATDINTVLEAYGLNVSEQRKLQQQLLQAQKMEAVGQLAGGVAHDFNNILTAIMGYGSLLQTKIKDDVRLNDYVKQILDGANRAAEVTKSLLAFSRKQVINPRPVDLNDIVRGVEKLLFRLIGEDIEITTTLSNKGVVCMVDAGQIEHVLMNLTTNARDAMPDGGRLFLRTEVVELDDIFVQSYGYGEPGMYAVLSVSDTGIGINHEAREKIFEPFFTTKEPGKGTGLGLAMVYGIIKQHGGYINVYSEPGNGTTFKIYLPSTQAKEDILPGGLHEPEPRGGTETILVAEDDENIRLLSQTILTQNGYEVISAKDGEDAVNKFIDHKNEIQLVIIDMIMPRKSGKEAYDEIKTFRPYIKVLFSSGYTGDRIDNSILRNEDCSFINKPVSPNDLLRKVRELLDDNMGQPPKDTAVTVRDMQPTCRNDSTVQYNLIP
ncbi:MAG: cache domain-containing protein [Dissulfurispiraceae bacterium]